MTISKGLIILIISCITLASCSSQISTQPSTTPAVNSPTSENPALDNSLELNLAQYAIRAEDSLLALDFELEQANMTVQDYRAELVSCGNEVGPFIRRFPETKLAKKVFEIYGEYQQIYYSWLSAEQRGMDPTQSAISRGEMQQRVHQLLMKLIEMPFE